MDQYQPILEDHKHKKNPFVKDGMIVRLPQKLLSPKVKPSLIPLEFKNRYNEKTLRNSRNEKNWVDPAKLDDFGAWGDNRENPIYHSIDISGRRENVTVTNQKSESIDSRERLHPLPNRNLHQKSQLASYSKAQLNPKLQQLRNLDMKTFGTNSNFISAEQLYNVMNSPKNYDKYDKVNIRNVHKISLNQHNFEKTTIQQRKDEKSIDK